MAVRQRRLWTIGILIAAVVTVVSALGGILDLGEKWKNLTANWDPGVWPWISLVLLVSVLALATAWWLSEHPEEESIAASAARPTPRRVRTSILVRKRYLDYLHEDVEQRLKASIHKARYLDVGMQKDDGAVDEPWRYVASDPTAKQFNSIGEAFAEFRGRLLLLGAPGSGKTTTLLHIAQTLVEKASDLDAPVPLLVNLSKFDPTRRRLSRGGWLRRHAEGHLSEENGEGWFEERLVEIVAGLPVTGLTQDVVRRWIADRRVALLLDGLDEVDDRFLPSLVQELNRSFLHKHPDSTAVVASRIIEYQPLRDSVDTRVQVRGAVTLQPLSREQINDYLVKAQATGLRDALPSDAVLYELAQTPLTLSIMTLAYAGMAPDQILVGRSFAERRRHLLDLYVDRMMQREARRRANIPLDLNPAKDRPTTFTREQVNRHLGWLAVRLSERMQTTFSPGHMSRILRLPAPDRQAPFWTFISVTQAISGCLVACALVLLLALIRPDSVAWWAALTAPPAAFCGWLACRYDRRRYVPTRLGSWLGQILGCIMAVYAVACYSAIVASLAAILPVEVPRMCLGIVVAVVASCAIVTYDNWKPDWNQWKLAWVPPLWIIAFAAVAAAVPTMRSYAWPAAALGAIVGLFLGLLTSTTEDEDQLEFAVEFAVVYAVIAAGLTVALALGLWWIGSPSGMDLAVLAAVGTGALFMSERTLGTADVAPLLGLVAGVLLGAAFGGIDWAVVAGVAGVLGILTFSVIQEPVGRWIERWVINPVLLALLALARHLPLRLRRFFRYGTAALLLKRVGDEFEFVHRLLRDHFAIRELVPGLETARGDDLAARLQQLSRQGESSVETLAHYVQNEDADVRRGAVAGLGRIATPDVLTLFRALVSQNPDPTVRAAVVQHLDKFEADEIIRLLTVAAADSSAEVRRAVMEALAVPRYVASDDLRSRPAELLHKGLWDSEQTVVQAAIIAAARAGTFLTLSSSAENSARVEAILHLVESFLGHGDSAIRAAAVIFLGQVRTAQYRAGFHNALNDPVSAVRAAAARVLAQRGDITSAPLLIVAGNDSDSSVRLEALRTLGRLSSCLRTSPTRAEIVQLLIRRLKQDRAPGVRREAADVLKYFGSPEASAALLEALSDNTQAQYGRSVAEVAAEALARLRDESVAQDLLRRLRSSRRRNQLAAARGLAAMPMREAAPDLARLLRQRRRRAIHWLLNMIGIRTSDPRLPFAIALARLDDTDGIVDPKSQELLRSVLRNKQ